MMKMKKRAICALLSLILLLAAPAALADSIFDALPGMQAADANTNTGIDIVVVIDRSGTMRDKDPQNIALLATNTLAEISSVDGSAGGVNIAVIQYGYEIIDEGGFFSASDPAQLQQLKDLVNSHSTVETYEDTNTGRALARACELIDAQRAQYPDHKFAVVLISDGKVDVGTSDGFFRDNFPNDGGMRDRVRNTKPANRLNISDEYRNKVQQATSASIQQGDAAVQKLANEGTPFYCIGIYSNDNPDTLGEDLKRWAGDDNYYTTQNPREVQNLMDDLYDQINPQAGIQKLTISPGNPGSFIIGPGVLQANIRIDPSVSSITACQLSLNGTPYPLDATNLQNIASQVSNNNAQQASYSILQLSRPQAGTYTLAIDDGIAHDYDVTIFSMTDLLLELDDVPSVSNGETTTVRLAVMKDGRPYYNNSLSLPVLKIVDESGNALPDLTMQWFGAENCYKVNFTPPYKGAFRAHAEMQSDPSLPPITSGEKIISIGDAEVLPNASAPLEIRFDGRPIKVYDANHDSSDGYAPFELSFDDLEANYFQNRDAQQITNYVVEKLSDTDNAIVDIQVDAANRKVVFTPKAATGAQPVSFNVCAEYAGKRSAPKDGTVYIEDRQAGVDLSGYAMPYAAKVSDGEYDMTDLSGVYQALLLDGAAREINAILPAEVQIPGVGTLFAEPNAPDEQFEWEVESVLDPSGAPTKVLEATKSGDDLTLRAASAGEVVLTLRATSYDNSSVLLHVHIKVVNQMTIILMIAGGALALVVLIAVIILAVHKKNKPSFLRGATLTVELTLEDDQSIGVAMLQRYGKKAVKLSSLCSSNGIHMGNLRSTLEKITVLPRRKGGVVIRRNLKGGKKETVMQPMDNWRYELDDDRMIELSYDEN